jgi:hypothetical protein
MAYFFITAAILTQRTLDILLKLLALIIKQKKTNPQNFASKLSIVHRYNYKKFIQDATFLHCSIIYLLVT